MNCLDHEPAALGAPASNARICMEGGYVAGLARSRK